MNANRIVDKMLEAGPDDPASALLSILPSLRTGEVRYGDAVIRHVISRDGTSVGVPTGGLRPCSSWCSAKRMGVRWSDGQLTWVCLYAVNVDGETATIL